MIRLPTCNSSYTSYQIFPHRPPPCPAALVFHKPMPPNYWSIGDAQRSILTREERISSTHTPTVYTALEPFKVWGNNLPASPASSRCSPPQAASRGHTVDVDGQKEKTKKDQTRGKEKKE